MVRPSLWACSFLSRRHGARCRSFSKLTGSCPSALSGSTWKICRQTHFRTRTIRSSIRISCATANELKPGALMKRSAYFGSRSFDRWPLPEEVEHYFLAPPERRWFFETTNDTACLQAEGVDGTDR